ncbi:hypothetical protein LTS01_007313 [Friedmanniomyces endolithicus]|nr:hypothetical protein LTS01_007313 [Friedmanniomyces endolithicus]
MADIRLDPRTSERFSDVRETPEVVPKAARDQISAGSHGEPALRTAVRLNSAQAVYYPMPRISPTESCVPQKRRLDHDEQPNFIEAHRSPPRLNRTFQRDHDALEGVRTRQTYHVSPERISRHDSHDWESGYGGRSSGRVYSQRTPSPPLRRPSHGVYQTESLFSLDARKVLSPVQSRTSPSSPFQKRGHAILSPEHDEATHSKRADHRNLTWRAKKPSTDESISWEGNENLRLSSNGSMSASSPPRSQVPAKIDFNGIKAVPTGPRPGAAAGSGRLSIGGLPEVDAAVKAAPHILIPRSCVPPDPSTLRHLRGFLGSPQPEGVFVDDKGYYLTWPDTKQGHLDLASCAARKHGLVLFGTYTVEAIVFHDGVPLDKHMDGADSALQKRPQSNASPPMPLTRMTEPGVPLKKSMPQDLDPAVRATPYIFVYGLPQRANMIKHLTGFLGSPKPEAVFVDKIGYYVVWPDTPQGHENLKKCIEKKNGTQIFSRYTVHMIAFYKGLPYSEGVATANPTLPVGPRSAAPPNVLLLEGTEPHDPPIKAALPTAGCKTNIATEETCVRIASPLRIPLRPDADNASSISGRTVSSDTSVSGTLKCHVCKVASTLDVDALAQCSTCSRRYHRRCHPFPPVPLDDESPSSWQCRRCVKKEIEACASLSVVNVGSHAELRAPSTLLEGLDGPPAKRARVEALQVTPGAVAGSVFCDDRFRGHAPSNSVQTASCEAATLEATAGVPAKLSRKDDHLDEADKLVEESFAALEAPRSEVPKAAVKPTLTRRKIARSPPTEMVDAGKENEASTAFTGNAPEKTWRGGEGAHLGKSNQSLAHTASTPSLLSATNEGASSLDATTAKLPTSASEPAGSLGTTNDETLISAAATVGAASPFPPPRSSITAENQPELNKSAAKANTELEVPETPELAKDPDLRMPSPNTSNNKGPKPLATHGIGSASPVDSVMQVEQRTSRAMPTTGVATRTKELRPKVGKCYQCRKPAFVDAAVGRGLCPDCKKAGNAKAATKVVGSLIAGTTTDGIINATGKKKNDLSAHSADTPFRTPVTGTGDAETAADATSRQADASISSITGDGFPRSQHAAGQAVAPSLKQAATAVSGQRLSEGTPKPVRETGEADRPDEVARTTLKLASGIQDKPSDETGTALPSKRRLRNRRASSLQGLKASASVIDQSATPLLPSLTDNHAESRSMLRPATRSGNASPMPAEASARSMPNDSSSGKQERRGMEAFSSEDILTPRRYSKYDRLIGFALIDAPCHRLQVRSIIAWIADNIPGYEKDGVPWPNRISMALSAATGKGTNLYIKEEMREDDANLNGKGSWWRLRPEVVSSVKRWDPAHWRPTGPPRGRSRATVEDERSDDDDGDEPPIRPRRAGRLAVAAQQKKLDGASESVENVAVARRQSMRELYRKTITEVLGKGLRSRVEEAPDTEDEEDMEDVLPGDGDRRASNASIPDEMPHAGMRRMEPTHLQPTAAPMSLPTLTSDLRSDVDMEDVIPAEIHTVAGGKLEPASLQDQISSHHTEHQRVDTSPICIDPYQTVKSSLAQLIKSEASRLEFTALSLFAEWPEHDPKSQLDKYAKMEEIMKRLTRKQMFAKPAMHSRLGSSATVTPHQSFNSYTTENCDSEGHTTGPSGDRRTQSPKKLSFQNMLFPLDERVREFRSVEDFFEMPDNAIPMYRSKGLAFRDGTRDKHGRLPRAGVYYHPGYE